MGHQSYLYWKKTELLSFFYLPALKLTRHNNSRHDTTKNAINIFKISYHLLFYRKDKSNTEMITQIQCTPSQK